MSATSRPDQRTGLGTVVPVRLASWEARVDPILVTNPADDDVFCVFARTLVDHGTDTTGALERRLRAVYPDAVVHARELANEPFLLWYVYRDGHWIRSSAATDDLALGEVDPRSRRRPTIDGGVDPARR
jgi:hypothetical protein